MSILRRILGIFVMIAGIIGLLLSVAGLVGIWVAKPALTESINATLQTLSVSVDTSQKALVITNQALGATVSSVDALSKMLSTTAATVEDTQPVITQVNTVMGKTLPATLNAARTPSRLLEKRPNPWRARSSRLIHSARSSERHRSSTPLCLPVNRHTAQKNLWLLPWWNSLTASETCRPLSKKCRSAWIRPITTLRWSKVI